MRWISLHILVAFAVMIAMSSSTVSGSEVRILGKVVDSEGEPIDGVLVSIQAVRVAFEKAAFTDKKGRFSIQLNDGSREYEIQLRKEGFNSVEEPLALNGSGLLRGSWTLSPGTGEEAADPEALRKALVLNEATKIYNEGADAHSRGEMDLALEKFEESASLNPQLVAPRLGMARIHIANGDFESALSNADALLELEPENVVGLRIRYDALAALARWSAANEALDILVTADATPGTARRVFNRGVEELKKNNPQDAAARFETALEIDPTLTAAQVVLSQIYLTLHRPEQAIRHAEMVVAQDPQDTEALSVLYQAHLTLGNDANAQQAFASLRSIDPAAVAKAFYKEGVAQFNAGDIESAIETLERVLEADPNHPKAHYSLGLCYLNSGNNAKAREFFNRFIQLAPEDPDVASAQEMLSFLN
jgi:tetratricopeptide (TPR) repeat protein